nr:histidine phosphatase family protein [Sedimentibacter sp.]
MTKIYITRHGETEWNKQGRFQGSLNSELTDKGLLAAELLSEAIENIDLDFIIASPLKRAYQTAEIVRGMKNIEIVADAGLQEINLGEFEGMKYDEIKNLKGDILRKIEEDPFTNRYPNGENLIEFYNRIEKTFKHIIKEYKGKNILVVAHGGTIKAIECCYKNKKIERDWIGNVVNNCSLSCVEIDENDNIKELFYNDTDHLKGKVAYNQ